MSDDKVVFEERAAAGGRCVAFARLNAERTLNALSLDMVETLQAQLDRWAQRDDVVCVVLYGAGDKGFCAGGDVVGLYKAMRAAEGKPSDKAEQFFASEYRLDHSIHRYPKPLLCWGHGTVMGGGLGLLVGASHRVVTERSKIAMPEITIGLFPDVGSSWFLGRMPNRIGLFLGLTTIPMQPADALWLGVADYYLDGGERADVFTALTELDWRDDRCANDSVLSDGLRHFERRQNVDLLRAASPVFARQSAIARITDAPDVVEFKRRLAAQADEDVWFRHGAKAMVAGSPTSMAVVHRQLHGAGRMSIEQAFQREFAIAVQCTRHPDLAEGVRALLVDKDRTPEWTPATLAEVDAARVETHFSLPDDYRRHPLTDLRTDSD